MSTPPRGFGWLERVPPMRFELVIYRLVVLGCVVEFLATRAPGLVRLALASVGVPS